MARRDAGPEPIGVKQAFLEALASCAAERHQSMIGGWIVFTACHTSECQIHDPTLRRKHLSKFPNCCVSSLMLVLIANHLGTYESVPGEDLMFTYSTRRKPIHGGSVPASLRATVTEVSPKSWSSSSVGLHSCVLKQRAILKFSGSALSHSPPTSCLAANLVKGLYSSPRDSELRPYHWCFGLLSKRR